MTDNSEWQGRVGQTWAAEWRRTDRSFGKVTEELLSRVERHSFDQVLDVGCGAGELSLAIGRMHRRAEVTGIDISLSLLEVARDRGLSLPNVRFLQADAGRWKPDRAPADLIVSRHGVMFFDDPAAAFANLAAAASDHGSLLFSCFRDRSENPFFTEIARLLPGNPQLPDPRAPGPFAFAEPPYVGSLLERGGWSDVRFDRVDFAMIAGAGDDPVEDAVSYFTTIGPAAAALREMDEGERPGFTSRVRELCRASERDGLVSLRAAAWIVSARKA